MKKNYPRNRMKRKHEEEATLFEHQTQAVEFMLQCEKTGSRSWLLSDEMGVGKTRETLALMKQSDLPGPWLVVTVAKSKVVWRDELIKFKKVSGWECDIYEIPNFKGGEWDFDERPQIILITYKLLGKILSDCERRVVMPGAAKIYNVEWPRVVLDEAHTIRNPEVLQSRACMALKSISRGAISGTPVHNQFRDIQTLAVFLKEPHVSTLIRQRTIRRMVVDVAKTNAKLQLPNISFFVLKWPFASQEERISYENEISNADREASAFENGQVEKGSVLRMISRSQLSCAARCCIGGDRPDLLSGPDSWENVNSTKMLMLRSFCKKHYEDDILMFSQWTSVLQVAAKALRKEGFNNIMVLTGGMNDQVVNDSIRQMFAREGRGTRIVIASITAFGQSLNWPFFNRVVFITPHWNPQVEYQAYKRAYRFGQTREVVVTRMIIAGTIEERVRQVAENKQNLEEQILDPTRSAKNLREMVLAHLPTIERMAINFRLDEEDSEVVRTQHEITTESESQKRIANISKVLLRTIVPLREALNTTATYHCRAIDDWSKADEEEGFPFPNVFVQNDEALTDYRQPFASHRYSVKVREDVLDLPVALYKSAEDFMTKSSTMAIQCGLSDQRFMNFKIYELANALRQNIAGEELDQSNIPSSKIPTWGVVFEDGAFLAFWPLRLFYTV